MCTHHRSCFLTVLGSCTGICAGHDHQGAERRPTAPARRAAAGTHLISASGTMILGLLLAALVSWKPRKTTSSTKPLNSLVHRPCRMSHRRLSDLYQDPDALQPRGGALQCSSPQCNLIILISLVILVTSRQSHTDRITPRRTASHRSPHHTQTAANQTPWLGP